MGATAGPDALGLLCLKANPPKGSARESLSLAVCLWREVLVSRRMGGHCFFSALRRG